MNSIFSMPSWKTGLIKRLYGLANSRIVEAVMIVAFFAMLLFMMITPILLAFYTPVMTEFNGL